MAWLRMARRFTRGSAARLALTVLAVAWGVALVAGVCLANRAVLRAFVEVIDTMAGRAALEVVAGEGGLFPEGVAATVGTVPGVEAAAPSVKGAAYADGGELLTVYGVDLTGDAPERVYGARLELDDPLVFLARPDSIALARPFAATRGLGRGDRLERATPAGRRAFTVRGLLDAEGVARAYGGNVAVMDLFAAEELFTRRGFITGVDVVVAPDADVREVAEVIVALLPAGLRVEAPAQRQADLRRVTDSLRVALQALGLFGLVAAFLITFNRLSTVFEERAWQLGVLRAVGLRTGAVWRALLGESLLGGAAGVALGIPFGLGLGRLLVPVIATASAVANKLVAPPAVLAPEPGALLGARGGRRDDAEPRQRVARGGRPRAVGAPRRGARRGRRRARGAGAAPLGGMRAPRDRAGRGRYGPRRAPGGARGQLPPGCRLPAAGGAGRAARRREPPPQSAPHRAHRGHARGGTRVRGMVLDDGAELPHLAHRRPQRGGARRPGGDLGARDERLRRGPGERGGGGPAGRRAGRGGRDRLAGRRLAPRRPPHCDRGGRRALLRGRRARPLAAGAAADHRRVEPRGGRRGSDRVGELPRELRGARRRRGRARDPERPARAGDRRRDGRLRVAGRNPPDEPRGVHPLLAGPAGEPCGRPSGARRRGGRGPRGDRPRPGRGLRPPHPERARADRVLRGAGRSRLRPPARAGGDRAAGDAPRRGRHPAGRRAGAHARAGRGARRGHPPRGARAHGLHRGAPARRARPRARGDLGHRPRRAVGARNAAVPPRLGARAPPPVPGGARARRAHRRGRGGGGHASRPPGRTARARPGAPGGVGRWKSRSRSKR